MTDSEFETGVESMAEGIFAAEGKVRPMVFGMGTAGLAGLETPVTNVEVLVQHLRRGMERFAFASGELGSVIIFFFYGGRSEARRAVVRGKVLGKWKNFGGSLSGEHR